MKQYIDLVRDILDNGAEKTDRTGTGTLSVFGRQMRFNLEKGFPIVTTKRVHFPSVVYELLWFLSGDTNIRYLTDHNVKIWNEWADENGNLGPMYGKQWRGWSGRNGKIDQIKEAIWMLKHKPNSRRIIVSAWNVEDLPDESVSPQDNVANGKMALAPCHTFFQLYVANGKLSCQLYQRSCDTFLGVPFNIASYALLMHMFAEQCGLGVGEFIWMGGDVHLYLNHLDQARQLILREPYSLPQLVFTRKPASVFEYQFEDFKLAGYDSHPAIKALISK